MSWDAIGALSEVIGGIAVVVSVIYLAIQIKKQTEEARLAATRDLARQMNDMVQELHADKEFLALYRKGITEIDSLPDDERLQIGLFFNRLFRVAAQYYVHYLRDRVEYYDSQHKRMREFLTFPGVQRWWELNREMHAPLFQAYIDGELIEARQHGHASTFTSGTNDGKTPSSNAQESDA
ncbi:MAG: hypothetical protein ACU84Q_21800 [Gammaproteobacteria bacterium]